MAMLPTSTQLAFNLSDFCRTYLIVVLPVIALLMWLDAKVFSTIYRKSGRRKALMWFWGISLLLVIAIAYLVIAMFLPRWMMGEIVSG